MPTATTIASLIEQDPSIRDGRPCLAGTGVTVHRVATWYKLGFAPEEIADRIGHVSLAQVHAALAYYHANQEQIESDIATDSAEADAFEQQYTERRAQA